jgi:hypothetical protein
MSQFLRALAAIAVLSLTGAQPRAARALPDRIDDAAFWRMIESLSEPGGYFRSDNFISNEGELQYVISDVANVVPQGRAYVGVGPEQNFTYIAALHPGIAFVVDIRRQNMVQHLLFKALMETSADRAEFLSRLFARPRPAGLDSTSTVTALFDAFARVAPDTGMLRRELAGVRAFLVDTNRFALAPADLESLQYVQGAFAQAGPQITYSFGQMGGGGGGRWGGWMPTLAEMMTETDENGRFRSYLAEETSYRYLRDLQQRNLIVPMVGDFGGDAALRNVARWLRDHDATVGVFYASNVEQYLFQQGAAAARFYANLGTFPTDSTSTFVRSASNRGWVPLRNPRSRMAQLTMRIEPMLAAIRAGRVANYGELILLRP